ncbi:Integral membrane protein TerC [uncultured Sporomusa sp.]|uniref:Integral membrane protein TerC n=1 Tax=uncultured Sporomusa sp. TaxID=307249 RepID=A0A212LR84_9FIRM|nr:TerC family protein [uncultured Sporomusa sp.]SCM79960.1 Integral membrane protein TerC [uncultured Sporomusa sp.]
MDFFGTIGPEWFMALGSILLVNLVLSGDNAVIIALASKNLPPDQRNKAIMWGSVGAVVLRIILTFVAAYLLDIPYLQFFGGLALLYIAISLLKKDEGEGNVSQANSYFEAIKIILFADLIMSLDNVLALAAIAQTVPSGKYGLITIGLATSIPLVVFGAQLLMKLMDRFPIIIYIGAGILGYAAAAMIVADSAVGQYVSNYALFLKIALTLAVVGIGYVRRNKPDAPTEAEG